MFSYPSPEFSGYPGNSLGVPAPSSDFSWMFPFSSSEFSKNICISLGIPFPSPDFSGIVPFSSPDLSSRIHYVACSHNGVFRDCSLPQPGIFFIISVLFLFPDRSFPGSSPSLSQKPPKFFSRSSILYCIVLY